MISNALFKRKQRGFTLIELLVVIAIIAILAAILFPVFAQAKLAAKASASISNVKQESLGMLTYAADYDDVAVPGTRFQRTQSDSNEFFAFFSWWVATWPVMIGPYVKNYDINRDPLGPDQNPIVDQAYWKGYNVKAGMISYGYNYTAFSPIKQIGTGGLFNQPIYGYATKPLTSAEKPAETVLLTSSAMMWVDTKTAGLMGSSPPAHLTTGNVDAPACHNQTTISFCWDGWGNSFAWNTLGGFFGQPNVFTQEAGSRTGGVAYRKSGRVTTAFADGHVKRLAITNLSAGTNWTPDISPTGVNVTDSEKYLWDLN